MPSDSTMFEVLMRIRDDAPPMDKVV